MRIAASLLACLLCLSNIHAGNWERFRGPGGNGVSDDKNIPVTFDEKKGILWKVAIPGLGNSSPIVWGDKVVMQSATTDGTARFVVCVDAATGKKLWQQTLKGAKAHTHKMNTLASSTPTTDGESVFAAIWDGNDVAMHAFSLKTGEPLWHKVLGAFTSQHGPGNSPVIYKDKVYYPFDMDKKSELYAFNKKTGAIAWKMPREGYRACYSAPQILENGPNGNELLITSTTAITSYNPDTGSQNWNWTWTFTGKMPLRTISCSIEKDGMLYACSGDGSGERQMVALKLPTVQGARPEEVWQNRKDFPYVPCLIFKDKHVYMANDKGFVGCFEGATGKKLWYERNADSDFTASPVMIDGKIYACSEQGDVYVFPAETSSYKVLAKNSLGERIRATPAIADNRLFIRGANHLFCISSETK